MLDRGAWCADTHRGFSFGSYLAVCVRACRVARQKYVVQHKKKCIFFMPRDEFGTVFVLLYIADTTIRVLGAPIVATSAEVGQPTIGALFVLPLLIADIMKGVIISLDAIQVLNNENLNATTIKPGELVDALYCAHKWYAANGCPALSDYYCEKANIVMRTKWYQDWALSL